MLRGKDRVSYYFIRILTIPIMFLPNKIIHLLGKFLGIICFYILIRLRKKTLSNLAIAKDLNFSNEEILKIGKKSFQNLAINILEYPKLSFKKKFSKLIVCENPEIADDIYKKKIGIIFFCGHQSNWEVLFLDGTSRMNGIAIGRPIKNKKLYKWIIKIREKNGGKIITPKNALREGLKCLKKGVFLGIVGDQGMPESSYHYPFFGTRAWTTTAPALLSYKTNSPIIVATTKRENNRYKIKYSDPIWPNLEKPLESEVRRIMDESLKILEKSIKKRPHEWLWQHNRWKQQNPKLISKRYRHDTILIILPLEKEEFFKINNHLEILFKIYSKGFLTILCPEDFSRDLARTDHEIIFYKSYENSLLNDYRFKLVYNFTNFKKINSHYLKYSAYEVITIKKMLDDIYKKDIQIDINNLSEIFKHSIYRKALKI
ncbi:MAG: hypothetical protein A3F40_01985 [Chlamydiae bacterium RIFCSPHIGHO2_12_FULL_27_8]|nr:MAG: hypothetical protein A3F40_01985 [Chlamydiae bacterium RIFCSPHIGHO2_12_FULL_27_8]